ncbi:hypothetical protein [Hyphomicrobium sp. DY-1]|uniref:hypothetical protein n=1 Tax=Hyphomicrobium sp. DY-1 TaxID=3075650 RepID=UPI0039C34B34
MRDIATDNVAAKVDAFPSECCVCHHNIVPEFIDGITRRSKLDGIAIELAFKCTNPKCSRLIIGRYIGPLTTFGTPYYQLKYLLPVNIEDHKFPGEIEKNYPRFADIYNQAHAAEQYGLLDVCGPGYRKALEFLIKTYLIKRLPEKEQSIKDALLANCIANFVQNENVKKVASRATWLGNDETHFVRKWEDKDIKYLKGLVQLTVSWVNLEEMTDTVVVEMPDPKKPKNEKV